MTAAEFQNDPIRREELATLLKNSVLEEALDILKNEMEANADLAVTLANPVVSAHRYHQNAGANHIVKGLSRLAAQTKEIKPLRPKTLRAPKKETP